MSRAISGKESSASALLELATRAADEGDYPRVVELFAHVDPAALNEEETRRWRLLLREAGVGEGAGERIGGPDPGPGRTEPPEAVTDDDWADFEPGETPRAERPVPQPIVRGFLRWFGGRGDVHARQWHDARRDRTGYMPVREPLTERRAEEHLLGRVTVGQYVLHSDDTVSFAALDLDPTPQALERMRLAPQGDGPLSLPEMRDYARRLRKAAQDLGLPAFVEDSGGDGLHVWLFFAPRLAARRARAVLRQVLARGGPQPPAVSIEVFPKQERLSGKGLGNLIKLPFGVHQKTLRPSRILDDDFEPLPAAEALARMRACPADAIEAITASKVVSLPHAAERGLRSQPDPPLPAAPAQPSPRGMAAALAAIAPEKAARRAADRMLEGCAVLRELGRRAREEHRLTADEARALLYSVGLVGRENPYIDEMFADAAVSRKELERVRQGLQSPVGCRRLRTLFPTVACRACPEAPPGGYATPALLALSEPPAFAPRGGLPEEALDEVIDSGVTERDADGIEERLRRIEEALQRLAREKC